MTRFVHTTHARTVVFGSGRLGELGDHLNVLPSPAKAIVVFASPRARGVVERLSEVLEGRIAGDVSGSAQHVPLALVDEAEDAAVSASADAIVAVGGGSMIGLAKAVAVRTGVPIVAVPTTYSGSEMTTTYGITSDGMKQTARDPAALPRLVVVDPELTAGLPAAVAGPSALNAMAHAVEALWAPARNPVTDLLADRAVTDIAEHLGAHVSDVADSGPRAAIMFAAMLAGMCLADAGLAFHHRACHVLGGSFGTPHAETHAVLLPHSTVLARQAAPERYAHLSKLLNGDAAARIFELVATVMPEPRLEAYGFGHDDVDRASELVAARIEKDYSIPPTSIREMLSSAVSGSPPPPP